MSVPVPEMDLRYRPAAERRPPRTLTPEQIAAFDRDGIVRPLRSAMTPRIAEVRGRIDSLLAGLAARGGGSYALVGYHAQCATIRSLCEDQAILDAVEDLIGPDIVCQGAHVFCKLPGDGKEISWHQDAPYWPLTPCGTVTAWLAIDDVDRGNAAMQVIPGSHRHGPYPTRESTQRDGNVLTRAIIDAEAIGPVLDNALPAGGFSLHSDMLVHGSPRLSGTRRRCGVAIRYNAPSVRCFAAWHTRRTWNEFSFLARGRDASGHWVDLPAPQGDDVGRDPDW